MPANGVYSVDEWRKKEELDRDYETKPSTSFVWHVTHKDGFGIVLPFAYLYREQYLSDIMYPSRRKRPTWMRDL